MTKNTIILAILSVFLFSCKEEKLPSNIKSAVFNIEWAYQESYSHDSLMENMDKKYIDNLSEHSIDSIFWDHDKHMNEKSAAKKQLDKLLMYNAEYANHKELNNIHKYAYKISQRYYDNVILLYDRWTLHK
jgi:hypothetical protein